MELSEQGESKLFCLESFLFAHGRPDSNLKVRKMPFYVYILHSIREPDSFYVGFSEDLEERLKAHDYGKDPLSSMPRVSILPPCAFPVVYSVARNLTPNPA